MLIRKINNKGFTLIEVLAVVLILALIGSITIKSVGSTLKVGREESYNLFKDNIVSISYTYVSECTNGTLTCDFSFEEKNTFTARDLQNAGYFDKLDSPLDGKDLGLCLVLEATKSNGITKINLIDNCY